jgi:ABC-type transport system involved in cytochrome bd biosynthesis fused ATPase/permease subunit
LQTRVLVTHGVGFLPYVDKIVVLSEGRISEIGHYKELLSHDGAFAQFLKNYLSQEMEKEMQKVQVISCVYIISVICYLSLTNM